MRFFLKSFEVTGHYYSWCCLSPPSPPSKFGVVAAPEIVNTIGVAMYHIIIPVFPDTIS